MSVAVLSLGTDQILHMLDVYPAWGEPMRDIEDNLLALFYRSVYAVIGGYVTARLASASPMRLARRISGPGRSNSTATTRRQKTNAMTNIAIASNHPQIAAISSA